MFRKRSEEGRRGKEGARGGASTRRGQGRSIAIPETVKSILSFCRLALGRPFPAGRGTTPGPNEFCRETHPTASGLPRTCAARKGVHADGNARA